MEVYCSPELIESIREQSKQKINQVNHHKNDVFCLGLTILELGLCKSVDKVITFDKLFDRECLSRYLTEFSKKFSHNPFLLALVTKMLEINPHMRPTFKGIDY